MRARLAPRQKCEPPPPNATCGFGLRVMSKTNGSSHTSSSRLAEMCQMTTRSPALICLAAGSRCRPVAVRRKCSTGERPAQHLLDRVVDAALGVAASAARTAPGWSSSAYMPCAVALRVVSLPATASSSMNMSNSSSLSCSPSISAFEQLGDDVVARVVAAQPGELVGVGEQLDERGLLVVVHVLGVAGADHPVGPVEQLAPVLLGHTHDLGDGLERQLGRDVLDEVGRPRLDHVVDDQRWRGGATPAR